MTIAIDIIGAHPTTESCLSLLQWLQPRCECANILDMGCGNGILSVTAASIWDAQVLAVDISEQALADAQGHIAHHQMQDHITLLRSDGFAEKAITAHAPYDLIIINMVAKQLIEMAPYIKKHLKSDGICLLSGMLSWLAPETEAVYKHLGFEKLQEIENQNWKSTVICHKTVTSKFLM